MIGFSREEGDLYIDEKRTISATTLSLINEKTIFRFFRITIKDENIITRASSLIKDRNNLFHVKPEEVLNEESFYKKIKKIYKFTK